MFEQAFRIKLRFNWNGVLTVEDLWDIKLSELDAMYRAIKKDVGDQSEGLMESKNSVNPADALRLKILEYVFKTRKEEQAEKANATKRKEDKQVILALIEEKEKDDLKSKDLDELKEIAARM